MSDWGQDDPVLVAAAPAARSGRTPEWGADDPVVSAPAVESQYRQAAAASLLDRAKQMAIGPGNKRFSLHAGSGPLDDATAEELTTHAREHVKEFPGIEPLGAAKTLAKSRQYYRLAATLAGDFNVVNRPAGNPSRVDVEHAYRSDSPAAAERSTQLFGNALRQVPVADRPLFMGILSDYMSGRKAPDRSFLGKFAERLKRGEHAVGENLIGTGLYFTRAGDRDAQGDNLDSDEWRFIQNVQQTRRGLDPAAAQNWFGRGLLGAAEMVPALAGSTIAGAAGGTKAVTAFWMTQTAAPLYEDLRSHGIDETKAKSVAMVASLPIAAIETIQFHQLARPIAEEAKQIGMQTLRQHLTHAAIEAGKTYGSEMLEEAAQEGLELASKRMAEYLDKEAPGFDWGDETTWDNPLARLRQGGEWRSSAGELGEAALAMPFLMAPGAGVHVGKTLLERKQDTGRPATPDEQAWFDKRQAEDAAAQQPPGTPAPSVPATPEAAPAPAQPPQPAPVPESAPTPTPKPKFEPTRAAAEAWATTNPEAAKALVERVTTLGPGPSRSDFIKAGLPGNVGLQDRTTFAMYLAEIAKEAKAAAEQKSTAQPAATAQEATGQPAKSPPATGRPAENQEANGAPAAIDKWMELDLLIKGFTAEQIRQMTPQQAWEQLREGGHAPNASPAPKRPEPAATTEFTPGPIPATGQIPTGKWSQTPPNMTPEAEAPKPATKPGMKGGTKTPPAAPIAEQPKPSTPRPDAALAAAVAKHLATGQPLDAPAFFRLADEAHGGTRAEGKYGPSDAYDAMETGVNLHLEGKTNPTVGAEQAKTQVAELQGLVKQIPSQTNRSGEKNTHQQFSTPPAYAYAAAWLANLSPTDVVLEPSAGVGGIAVQAKNSGAQVYGNELSKRRAALLGMLNLAGVTNEDAEQAANILPGQMPAPSVVLMNPPFSHAASRLGDKRVIGTDLKHVDAALQFLQPGGRLVAIIGAPLHGGETQTFARWYSDAIARYNVRANVLVGRDVYKGYGTTFPTRVLVIDKTGVTPANGTLRGDAATLDDLIDKLTGVRNDRTGTTAAQQQPVQPTGQASAGATPAGRGSGLPVQPATGAVGTGQQPAERPVGDVPGASPAAGANDAGVGPAASAAAPAASGERTGEVAGNKPALAPESPGPTGSSQVAGNAAVGQPGAEATAPGATSGSGVAPATGLPSEVAAENRKQVRSPSGELGESVFEPYRPSKMHVPGAKPHPGSIVESAAMAAVEAPDVRYKTAIPRDVIDKGLLSEIQLEPIFYGGQAHEKMLPPDEKGVEYRQGYMVGDGTGVGKGRIIAGFILDNMAKGRSKAVWVSKNIDLLPSAKRDWKGLGQSEAFFVDHGKVAAGEAITQPAGILFTTYGRMWRDASDAAKAKGSTKSRLQQIIDWVGPDFDGVIAFDESHLMSNAVAATGGRGDTGPSEQGKAGLDLQKALPKARIVYVSATSATEVRNLGYADRLALWGKGTQFANVAEFIAKIADGGVAAMELVARDMKAMGKYLARSLSFNDGTDKGTVTYDRLEHELTGEQRQVYDKLAEAWQVTLNNFNAALGLTGGNVNGRAVSAARSAFWSAHQRFFNQVITAMQLPSVLKGIQKDLDAGSAVVIQLTNTGQAAQERALARRQPGDDLADFDSSPADALIQMVEKSFPTQQYEQFIDDNGRVQSRPVVDSKGNPVQNAAAVAAKKQLLEELGSIAVPNSPLDAIIDHFGHENVAEVTGRSRRVILMENEKGQRVKTENNRSKGFSNQAEIASFQQGKKRILLFSEAGGTGASYHADLSVPNQQPRAHYLLQAGWKAATAIQGLGRTHRTNQAQAPKYVLVHTDLKGQKRFLSTIARRLSQLGALTKGQRQTGSSGIFTARDNLEGTEARDALKQFYSDLAAGNIDAITLAEFEQQTGLQLRDKNGQLSQQLPGIEQFLNRLLSLKVDLQNAVFDAFDERLQRKVEQAAAEGRLDVGVENLVAEKVEKVAERVAYTEPESGATTKYVKLRVSNKTKPTTFHESELNKPLTYVVGNKGKIFAVEESSGKRTDEKTGEVHPQYRLRSPLGTTRVDKQKIIDREGFREVQRPEAKQLWDKAVADAPEYQTHDVHMITGVILPIWNRLHGHTQVRRTITNEGEQILGRVIPTTQVAATLANLGVREDGTSSRPNLTPQQAVDAVLDDGATLKLENGWRIKRSRVQNEQRIELIGPNFVHHGELDSDGIKREVIGGKPRYFVPVGDNAARVMEAITKTRPIVEAQGVAGDQAMARRDAEPEAGGQTDVRSSPGAPTVPATMATPAQQQPPVSAHAIIATMSKLFDVPIRAGRLSLRGALGIYRRKPQVVRMHNQATNDLAVASHEVAHHLDNTTDVRKGTQITPTMRTELKDLDYEPDKQRASEGFAEFMRLFWTNEEAAASDAPEFYNHFVNTWLPAHPDISEKIERVQHLIDRWREQGAAARIEANIGRPGQPAGPVQSLRERGRDYLREKWYGIYSNWVDKGHALNLLDKAAKANGYKFDGGQSPAGALFAAYGMTGPSMAARAIEEGPYLVTTGERLGPGLREILAPINEEEYPDFRRFLIANHASEVFAKKPNMNPGVSKQDARYVLEEIAADPAKLARYRKAAQGMTAFNHGLLDMLVDAGVIASSSAEKMKAQWETYIPLFRAVKKGGGGFGRRLVDLADPIRRRRGSGRQVLDPIQSTMRQAAMFYDRAIKQQVALQLVREADPELGGAQGLGGLVERVPPGLKKTTLRLSEVWPQIVKAMDRHGLIDEMGIDQDEIEQLGELFAEDFANIYRPDYSPVPGEHIVRVIVNGQPRLYQVDPDLYRAVQGMSRPQLPWFVKIFSELRKGTQLGAVALNPDFAAANIQRDWSTSQVQAKYQGADSTYMPFVWIGRYLKSESARRGLLSGESDDTVRLWQEFNGQLAAMLGLDERSLEKMRKELLAHSSPQHLREMLVHPVDTVREMIGVSEVGPRLAEFSGVLKKHGYIRDNNGHLINQATGMRERPPRAVLIEAINAANDVTVNFKRMGFYGQWVNEFVPFFNAAIAGTDKMLRTGGEAVRGESNWKRVSIALALRAAGVVAYWLARSDDDDYKAEEDWLKYGYYSFTNGDGAPVMRVSKGYDWSVVDNTVEGILNSFTQGDAKPLRAAMYQQALKTFPALRVSGVQPAMESYFNYDFFREKPIENEAMQRLRPGDRATPYNTELMKWLGDYLNISPAKLEHFVDSITGGAYRRVSNSTSRIASGKAEPADIPFTGAFAVRKDYVAAVDDFYQEKDRLEQEYNSAKLKGQPLDELAAKFHKFEDYAELMSELRKPIQNERGRDARFAYEKYIAGLARAALGQEPLDRYPNPLKPSAEMPKDVAAIRRDFTKRLRKRLEESPPNRKIGEHLDKFKTRQQQHRLLVARTRQMLAEIDRH